ncbi:MAG: hemerythrin family protein [Rhodocyclaceae bacterium]|nr:hemerythrin family protein [Rhodocyclaceae bacterium]
MLINEWTPSLEIGVGEMDQDHRVLFDLLQRIQHADEQGDFEEAKRVLEELHGYTEWHFAREEALMRIHRYEFAAEHRDEHRRLSEQVAHMQDELAHDHLMPHDIATFMQRWLVNHIAGADRHAGEAIARSRSARERGTVNEAGRSD